MLYSLGTLPEEEREDFESLVRSDRELRSLVHENQTLNELIATECRSVEPPFQAYAKIMREIEGAAKAEAAFPVEAAARERGRLVSFVSWSGWAAAACVAVAFAFLEAANVSDIVVNNLSNPRLVAVKTPSAEISMEDRLLELTGIAEAYWFAREGVPSDQMLADAADTEMARISGGFTVFDRKFNIGFIAVENMPKESEGKSYHVWAKTGRGSRPIQAGALPIGDESRGLFFFELSDLPAGTKPGALSFFVTEEESDDPQQPSQVVLLSDL